MEHGRRSVETAGNRAPHGTFYRKLFALLTGSIVAGLAVVAAMLSTPGLHRHWDYDVAYTDLDRVSALVLNDGILYVSLEHPFQQGRIISIKGEQRTLLVDSLEKPDGMAEFGNEVYYTQEFGEFPVFSLKHDTPVPLFYSNCAEGIDVAANGDIYVVEDRPQGRLLKFSRNSGVVSTLAEGLEEAEGICVMDNGDVYYAEKELGVIFRLRDQERSVFIDQLNKPAYLYCDTEESGIWITEDRTNFGRLIHADVSGATEDIVTRLKSPQSITFTTQGDILLAEQGRNRVLRIVRRHVPEQVH